MFKWQKEIPRNTASLKLVRFHAWNIGVARLTSKMTALSHIILKKSVCNFPFFYVVCFFYNLRKFDIINAEVPVCKRGSNLETKQN